jgi:hypothetical protein
MCNAISMIELRAIEPSDINEVKSWLDYRDPATVDVDLSCLSPGGFIVPQIAACWFTMTDAPVMYVDTFVTNPRAELAKRREAGRLFHCALVEVARVNNIKRVLFLTRNKAVMEYYAQLWGNAVDLGQYHLFRVDRIT